MTKPSVQLAAWAGKETLEETIRRHKQELELAVKAHRIKQISITTTLSMEDGQEIAEEISKVGGEALKVIKAQNGFLQFLKDKAPPTQKDVTHGLFDEDGTDDKEDNFPAAPPATATTEEQPPHVVEEDTDQPPETQTDPEEEEPAPPPNDPNDLSDLLEPGEKLETAVESFCEVANTGKTAAPAEEAPPVEEPAPHEDIHETGEEGEKETAGEDEPPNGSQKPAKPSLPKVPDLPSAPIDPRPVPAPPPIPVLDKPKISPRTKVKASKLSVKKTIREGREHRLDPFLRDGDFIFHLFYRWEVLSTQTVARILNDEWFNGQIQSNSYRSKDIATTFRRLTEKNLLRTDGSGKVRNSYRWLTEKGKKLLEEQFHPQEYDVYKNAPHATVNLSVRRDDLSALEDDDATETPAQT